MQPGDMLGIAHQSSMRIVEKGLLGLSAAVLALLCTLVLATGAHAEATSSTPTPVGEPGRGLETPAEPTGPVNTPEVPVQTTTPVTTTEGGGETTNPVTPAETTPPVTTETTTETTPPATTETTTETTPPVTTELPVEPTIPVTLPEVKPPEITTTETTKEVAAPVTTAEGSSGDISSAGAGSLVTQDTALHAEVAGEPAAEPAQETAGASSGSLFFATTGAAAGGPPSANTGMASAVAPAVLVAAQLTKELSCGLSALGGRESQSCGGGWLGTRRLFSDAPEVGVDALAATMVVATGAVPPSHGVHGGSAVGNAPVGPAPPSAPGGASGSAAGASGFGISSILTLAGLLLLAAPRAMRRLRLSCRPWLTACFVLIPERPG
jgi:hypothetical protein